MNEQSCAGGFPVPGPDPSGAGLPDAALLAELAARHFYGPRSGLRSAPLPYTGSLDVRGIRRDFPILSEQINGRDLIWLDNAATTQKPRCVIDRLSCFYRHENSNIHRAAHTLAARSTAAFEAARDKVRRFLHARSGDEIVFVRGATEAVNLVAQAYGRRMVNAGDEIVVSVLEHHSNIVPWQMLCAAKGATLRVIPADERGHLDLCAYEKLLSDKTKIVAIAHVSNVLGTVSPIREMADLAHRHGARILVDGAQAAAHTGVDVAAADADFYALSGHKLFGPTGVGVLYGKAELLKTLLPWQGGGNMIEDVTFENIRYRDAPHRFEAGTASIADAAGLGAAIDYLNALGPERLFQYEHRLCLYGIQVLESVPGLKLVGSTEDRVGILSFDIDGISHDVIGRELDREGIAVRTGHHCAQPALRRYGYESLVRVSLAFYNTKPELDETAAVLRRLARGRGRSAAVRIPGIL